MKKTINNLSINYRTRYNSNKDKVVFLLHGWGGNLNSFLQIENFLFNHGYSIINLDFPGFGASEQPLETYSLSDYVEIVKQIINLEQIQNVYIIAHSFGGRVAIKLASETDYVNKMILVDSAGIKPKFSLRKALKIARYKHLKKINEKRENKKDLTRFGSDDFKAVPEQLKPVFVRIVNEDLTPCLKNITTHTLLVWGSEDTSTPLYMARKIKRHIKDCGLIVFKNAGHFSYIERHKDFEIITKEFLK